MGPSLAYKAARTGKGKDNDNDYYGSKRSNSILPYRLKILQVDILTLAEDSVHLKTFCGICIERYADSL